MAALVSAPVDCVPEVALPPLHAPEAVHEVALVLAHVSVELAPETTVVGFAVRVSVGAGFWLCRVTIVEALLEPSLFVQVSVKVVVAVIAGVVSDPDVALLPAQPPEAEHEAAFVALHVRVLVCPLVTAVGLALIWTAGRLAVAVAGQTAHCGASP